MRAGVKTNVIPDVVDLQVDIRTLPGQRGDDVKAMLREALGSELFSRIEIADDDDNTPTESPTDTPLWDSMARVAGALIPNADIVPLLSTGATDARFYRRLGVPAYGAGLFSERIAFADFGAMFHGDDERIDIESLDLSTEFFTEVAKDFLDA
jgi:acetylornithine deacetylase/succinyl-diaminopimelate desuccinylase-like protein